MASANSNSRAPRFSALVDEAVALLRKARRHRHSLTGTGYYAKAYWEAIGAIRSEGEAVVRELETRGAEQEAELLRTGVERIASTNVRSEEAEAELGRLRTAWSVAIEPRLRTSPRRTRLPKNFLAPEFRESLPGSARPVFNQVEGCYAYEFRDAALVMLRKLVESLIVQGYVKAQRAAEIKDSSGEYLTFGALVGKAKSGELFRLSRESKSSLDEVKKLGDSAAHDPCFHARKSDLEGLKSGARILVENLLENIAAFSAPTEQSRT